MSFLFFSSCHYNSENLQVIQLASILPIYYIILFNYHHHNVNANTYGKYIQTVLFSYIYQYYSFVERLEHVGL